MTLKIKDVSQEIADEHAVSKKDVELLFNYFYQDALKDSLLSFKADEVGIKHLGIFRLNYYKLDNLTQYCKKKLTQYTEEVEQLKDDIPEEEVPLHWKYKSFLYYQDVLKNLGNLEEKRILKDSIKETKRKQRQYELDREIKED